MMRSILVKEPGVMILEETAIPEITRDDQVLVRVHYAGICGSDVGVYSGGNPYAVYPVVIGHEASGEVVKVGNKVANVCVGDSVVFEPITYCGKCYACRTGHHNVCKNLKVLGCIEDGVFRDYAIVKASQVYKFDNTKMTYKQAAICEPYTIGFQAVDRGGVIENDFVLVHGAGPIGLIIADVAMRKGAKVIISEPNNQRLEFAKEFGVDYAVNPMQVDLDKFCDDVTNGEGVNVIFDAAGAPSISEHALYMLSPAGRFVPMTYGKNLIPLDFKQINAKQLSIIGTRHQYNKFMDTIEFLPTNLEHVDKLITDVYDAEDYEKAFKTLGDKDKKTCKVMLKFI